MKTGHQGQDTAREPRAASPGKAAALRKEPWVRTPSVKNAKNAIGKPQQISWGIMFYNPLGGAQSLLPQQS